MFCCDCNAIISNKHKTIGITIAKIANTRAILSNLDTYPIPAVFNASTIKNMRNTYGIATKTTNNAITATIIPSILKIECIAAVLHCVTVIISCVSITSRVATPIVNSLHNARTTPHSTNISNVALMVAFIIDIQMKILITETMINSLTESFVVVLRRICVCSMQFILVVAVNKCIELLYVVIYLANYFFFVIYVRNTWWIIQNVTARDAEMTIHCLIAQTSVDSFDVESVAVFF